MKKQLVLFLFVTLSSYCVLGQYQTNIDSLKLAINAMPDDTMKVKKINKICMQLISTGMFDDADVYINQAQKLSDKLHFKKGQGNALNFKGIICDDKGQISQALDYYFKALKIFEEINHYGGITDISNNIGLIYLNQNQLDKALSYFFKAKKYAELSKKKFILDNPINNIGSVYFKKKDYTNALKFYNESYELRKELEFFEGCIQSLTNLGNVYVALKDTDLAISKYVAALDMAIKINDPRSISIVKASLGSVYFKINKKQSIAYLKEGLFLANQINLMDVKRTINKRLSDYYISQHDSAKAFLYFKEYISAKDSIFNQENTKKVTSSEMNYLFDKKEALAKVEQEKKDVITREEKNKQRVIIYSIMAILLMLGLLTLFIYKGYKQKQKDNLVITKQKYEVEHQKQLIEEHQQETIDSINYAKKIQHALLANHDFVDFHIPNNFILFQPKDIVSGDFYWTTEHHGKFYLAVCDSTGHGVPGAFMSLLNMGFLNEAIKEKNISHPNEVLNYVRKRLMETIGNEGQQDGMDAILICMDVDLSNQANIKTITYSAANNEPVLIKDNEIVILPKDKMPVGKGERSDSFKSYTVTLQKGDSLYLYTDGYADQFGGPKGKKFKRQQLNNLLLSNSSLSLIVQSENLKTEFVNWKGDLEQVDDVCVIGIKL